MNGAQDLGGQMGHGPIALEPGEPNFHAKWEERAFAITLAMGATGTWTLDASRFARESLPPAEYLASSYYEIWTKGLEKLVVQYGLVTAEELRTGTALEPAKPVNRVLAAESVPEVLAKGAPVDRPAAQPPRFRVGDHVHTKRLNPEHHTRLPGYARDTVGQIEAIHGVHVFPDANAHGKGDQPAWLYGVAFEGPDLWGPGTDRDLVVRIDLWEPYLELASKL
ncbi:nitrile hydratase subunit beta [Roseibium denhamense]|uniref:Nitrile hydratase subunit beta n=1 Tax=Roseibium denhamense TaxID=76305 RepID=A0ABY1PQ82_9HYPH|nr:nitrile hydratase subunit beta [Roseibium denhamense]MTI05772.1 nitrile hydratase subunit beta [Roseibium denhamense]SMP37004.1 nitrile hydratase [Roseibium denhamense]